MPNSIEINEKKFERIRWTQKDGVFFGTWKMTRKPFGEFEVKFQVYSKNGITGVEVRNSEYSALYWGRTYPDYEQAILGVKERFETIDELIDSLRQRDEELKEQMRRQMSEAISAALLGEEQMKEQGE